MILGPGHKIRQAAPPLSQALQHRPPGADRRLGFQQQFTVTEKRQAAVRPGLKAAVWGCIAAVKPLLQLERAERLQGIAAIAGRASGSLLQKHRVVMAAADLGQGWPQLWACLQPAAQRSQLQRRRLNQTATRTQPCGRPRGRMLLGAQPSGPAPVLPLLLGQRQLPHSLALSAPPAAQKWLSELSSVAVECRCCQSRPEGICNRGSKKAAISCSTSAG